MCCVCFLCDVICISVLVLVDVLWSTDPCVRLGMLCSTIPLVTIAAESSVPLELETQGSASSVNREFAVGGWQLLAYTL